MDNPHWVLNPLPGSLYVFFFLYVFIIYLYAIFGASIFLVVEGPNEKQLAISFEHYCNELEQWVIGNGTGAASNGLMLTLVRNLDHCYRNRSHHFKPLNHRLDNFFNSLVYSVSIVTSIGYGVSSASTYAGQIITCIYAVLGVPLYFGFHEELAGWIYQSYNDICTYARNLYLRRQARKLVNEKQAPGLEVNLEQKRLAVARAAGEQEGTLAANIYSIKAEMGIRYLQVPLRFLAPAIVFVMLMFLLISLVYLPINEDRCTGWDLHRQFYFFVQSCFLIGFGDVYPQHSWQGALSLIAVMPGNLLATLSILPLQFHVKRILIKFSSWLVWKVNGCPSAGVGEDGGRAKPTSARSRRPPPEAGNPRSQPHSNLRQADKKKPPRLGLGRKQSGVEMISDAASVATMRRRPAPNHVLPPVTAPSDRSALTSVLFSGISDHDDLTQDLETGTGTGLDRSTHEQTTDSHSLPHSLVPSPAPADPLDWRRGGAGNVHGFA